MAAAPQSEECKRRPRIRPLRRQADFQRLYRHGRRASGAAMTAIAMGQPEEASGELRVAFVISRKNAKQAVARNRLRRRLREALRGLLREHSGARPADLLLIAGPRASECDFWQLRAEIDWLLRRLGLWAEGAAS